MAPSAAPPPALDPPIPFETQVEVRDRVVTLDDLADLSRLPPEVRRQVGALPVFKMPVGREQVEASAGQLQMRVGALAPALQAWLTGPDHSVHVRYVPPKAPATTALTCVMAREAVAADAAPTPRSFMPAPCAGVITDALWFDARSGVVRARRALHPGDVLTVPPASAVAAVAPGDPLVIEATVGPVRVQRRVFALQPARPGEHLFARTSGGSVISIPYPSAGQ